MKLLALDTAANLCSVAVLDVESGVMLAEISDDIGKGHAERLMGIIEQTLRSAGVALGEIGRIAVSIGPGSFTGVRVGVSTARGFSLALQCPAVGITTLEALAFDAAKQYPGRPVHSIIDARREEVYAQSFKGDGTAASEPTVTNLPEILELLSTSGQFPVLSGSGAGLVNERLEKPLEIAAAGATGTIEAFARIGAARVETGEAPKPLYLRGLDVKPQQGFVLQRRQPE